MTTLPNPFFAGGADRCPVETAAVSPVSSQVGAAAELFTDGPDIPLAELMKRGFDAEGFIAAIEPMPLFLQAPIEALQVLARH